MMSTRDNSNDRFNQYVQRDLEDLIREELERSSIISAGNVYSTNLNNREMSENTQRPQSISLREVVTLLKAGYTRYERDTRGYGSIQVHFNLNATQVKELFLHPKLRGLKTKFPSFIVVDDLEDGETSDIEEGDASEPAEIRATPPEAAPIVDIPRPVDNPTRVESLFS